LVDNWTSATSPYQPNPELFAIRRAAAMQAYYEHMPLRRAQMPSGSAMQLYRRTHFGDLMTAHFLDTRQYRSALPCQGGFDPICPGIEDRGATVLGAAQEAWLAKGLRSRDTRWNLIAQQVMMMSLERRIDDGKAQIRNVDSWAGYEVARQRMLDLLAERDNAVVMTGDEHQNFAGELRRARKDETVAVEIVTTSISSGGDGWVKPEIQARIRANNPDLRYASDRRGYALCEVGRDQWRTFFRGVDQVSRPGGTISTLKTAVIEPGRPALHLS
jgi:alkaline phosphatase D